MGNDREAPSAQDRLADSVDTSSSSRPSFDAPLAKELLALVISTAEALFDPRPSARAATLARLKELYVTCEADTCTTHPEVARTALPHACRALTDPDPEVRINGALAIELFAVDAGASVLALAPALVDPVASVRLAALGAACELGRDAAVIAPQIAERLARAPSAEERAIAADALGNSGVQTDHLDVLLDTLVNDVAEVQAGAAQALAMALGDPSEERREQASRALRTLGRERKRDQ